MQKTQREFTNIETKERFALYVDRQSHAHTLVNEDTRETVKKFYISSHINADIKINNSKVITIPSGCFYKLKESEVITHIKYLGFKKFRKY